MNQIEIYIFFFLFNLFLIINFKKIKFLNIIVDRPDKVRKFHQKPTALAGGIILIINIFFYFIFLNFNKNLLSDEIIFETLNEMNIFICSCFLIFLLGIIDDKIN